MLFHAGMRLVIGPRAERAKDIRGLSTFYVRHTTPQVKYVSVDLVRIVVEYIAGPRIQRFRYLTKLF